jgi:hypothetical protein
MVRFKNKTMEALCKEALSPEDNELKIVHGPYENIPIIGLDENLEHIMEKLERAKRQLSAVRKAYALSLVAKELSDTEVEELEEDC